MSRPEPPTTRAARVAAMLLASGLAAGAAKEAQPTVKAKRDARTRQIAAMLPAKPAGFGRPVGDRDAWMKLAKRPDFRRIVRRAEGLLKTPVPPSPDELYLDFSKTGNRSRWERVAWRRRERVGTFALAECVENKGRFLPALERAVAAVCKERTWVMPAHDRSLANFKATRTDIDLGSSHLAWRLALTDHLLGEKLTAPTRKLIGENLRRRIFDPYLAMVAGKRKANWWIRTTNNWNAVCLAGVTGSALAAIDSPARRARFIVAAEEYSRNFLKGFTPDGYCSEGLGYWGYGFGYYVLLGEAIHQATGGKVDLLARPRVREAATYPERLEIIGGVYPAFADCGVGATPSWRLVHFIGRRLGLGARAADDAKLPAATSTLETALMYSFANSATRAQPVEPPAAGPGARSYFADAGVLICRPGKAAGCRIGAAMKGGHNAEHHNHNDVGSYVVVVSKRPVLLDVGAEVYTARTFSARRYESNVLNSFGHPVPRIGGQLQKTGRKAAGRVVRTDFSDRADTFVLDLRAAYGRKGLRKLQRTFVYSRRGPGSLTVTDEMEAARPEEFETALMTLGRWKRLGDGAIVVYDADEAVRVDIDAGAANFEVRAERITEDVRTKTPPTRLGIRLTEPAAAATIRLRITPTAKPGGGDAGKRQ